jgi:hypothetical protein
MRKISLMIGLGAHTYFHGTMSDLRLYNCVLTESEINALAQKGVSG